MFKTKFKLRASRLLSTIALAIALAINFSPLVRAADYNCGAYGAGSYSSGEACGATTPDEDGGLVDTGERVLMFAIPAGAILAGTVMLYRLRKKKKPSSKE